MSDDKKKPSQGSIDVLTALTALVEQGDAHLVAMEMSMPSFVELDANVGRPTVHVTVECVDRRLPSFRGYASLEETHAFAERMSTYWTRRLEALELDLKYERQTGRDPGVA